MTPIEKIRWFIFRIWFLSMAAVIAVFSERMIAYHDIRPEFSEIFPSFQTMMGLVLPQIAIMMAFYFNLKRNQKYISTIDPMQISITIYCSVAYHVIFYFCLVAGITFGIFAPSDGNQIQRNVAAISSIMALFSVLLVPIAYLFSQPHETADGVTPKGG